MSNSDSIREAIERLSQQEKNLIGQLNEVRVAIRTLKRTGGIEVGAEEEAAAGPTSAPIPDTINSPTPGNSAGRSTIRPDEFFGATHAEAARRYLKKVGFAVSFTELVDALRKGGCKLTSSEPEKVLWISLIKNSKDFVPPQPGFVGLKEFYPARARARAISDRKATKAKRPMKKSKTAPKRAPKPKTNNSGPKKAAPQAPPTPGAQAPKEIPLAVQEFMGDKQFHSTDEIVGAVRKKLGGHVKVVSVHGALSGKVFEKNDEGMYRMKLLN